MGKNLYETPRDKSKWNVRKDVTNKEVPHQSDRKAHLEELKKRYQKKKK